MHGPSGRTQPGRAVVFSMGLLNQGARGVYGPPDWLVTTDGLDGPPWVLWP